MDSDIKKCPFCGAEVREENDDFYCGILCSSCGYGWNYEGSADIAEIKKQWNNRPLEDKLFQEIVRLRNILKEISNVGFSLYDRIQIQKMAREGLDGDE